MICNCNRCNPEKHAGMTFSPPTFEVPEPEFAEGDPVWLHPRKDDPSLRYLCRVTHVARYGAYGQTIFYYLDYVLEEGEDRPPHDPQMLSAHWIRPRSAVVRLGELYDAARPS